MKTAVQDTSIDAFHTQPLYRLKTQQDRICEIVSLYTNDMSLREIKRAYRVLYDDNIDVSTVSARVNALIAAKRLERLTTTRKCSITGVSIHPVRVLQVQPELFQ